MECTRNVLVKNKHSNYGEYIHLFSGLVKCPICGEIMSSSESFKYPNGKQKVYYHLRCKNHNCSEFGLHYNTEKIETKLKQVLEELTLFEEERNDKNESYLYKKRRLFITRFIFRKRRKLWKAWKIWNIKITLYCTKLASTL